MYVLTHVCVGALVGAPWRNPVGAALTGLVSHGLLDAIPHHDYKSAIPALADGSLGMATLWLLAKLGAAKGIPLGSNTLVIGGLAAAFPDVEVAFAFIASKIGGRRRWHFIYPSHSGLIPHGRMAYPQGFWLQVMVIALSMAGIWRLHG